jgi:hypothetical protein
MSRLTRADALIAEKRTGLERAISILETDRLAVMDLNLARDLLRRVVRWEAELKRCPAITDLIMGEYSMWAPLIRITIEDADRLRQPMREEAA